MIRNGCCVGHPCRWASRVLVRPDAKSTHRLRPTLPRADLPTPGRGQVLDHHPRRRNSFRAPTSEQHITMAGCRRRRHRILCLKRSRPRTRTREARGRFPGSTWRGSPANSRAPAPSRGGRDVANVVGPRHGAGLQTSKGPGRGAGALRYCVFDPRGSGHFMRRRASMRSVVAGCVAKKPPLLPPSVCISQVSVSAMTSRPGSPAFWRISAPC